MSQSRQALRSRIKSVNSTKKITKAMEMIANAKLFKQRAKMEANRDYAQRLQETLQEICANNPQAESKFLIRNGAKKKFAVIFASDLGLCGSYNSNILNFAESYLDKEDIVVLVGTSLYRQMQEAGFTLQEEVISSDKLAFATLKDILQKGCQMYMKEEVGEVVLIYTQFINTMRFEATSDILLPCQMSQEKKPSESHVETLFEPDPSTILDHLIPMMIQDVAYADWLESTTSEQGSRRMAMKTATDNANDLSEQLQLAYNKARQAAITREITEIVAGSSAV